MAAVGRSRSAACGSRAASSRRAPTRPPPVPTPRPADHLRAGRRQAVGRPELRRPGPGQRHALAAGRPRRPGDRLRVRHRGAPGRRQPIRRRQFSLPHLRPDHPHPERRAGNLAPHRLQGRRRPVGGARLTLHAGGVPTQCVASPLQILDLKHPQGHKRPLLAHSIRALHRHDPHDLCGTRAARPPVDVIVHGGRLRLGL